MPSVAVCITLGKSKIRNFRKKLATSTRLFRKKDALNNPGKFFPILGITPVEDSFLNVNVHDEIRPD